MMTYHVRQKGFTLLELLIAITIFTIMSVMAYSGLSNVIDNSGVAERELRRMKEIQTAVFKMDRDFNQIVRRDIRDEFGEKLAYLITDTNNEMLIEFSRNGRRNPAKLIRSHLVRVAYRHEEGRLYRIIWPRLDRVQGMQIIESEILSDVTGVSIRFLDDDGTWHRQWPPLTATAGQKPADLSAIELVLSLDDWGDITRLYNVGLL